ncbi:MAG: hypothetical protein KDC24_10465 [Saprospiraceae bacterium]|nr:hypothetical protein [Saprospiraceae bacterium]
MKTKHLLMILIGIFLSNISFSQKDQSFRVYSEVTSFLRGNSGSNISVEFRNRRHYFGVGFDQILINRHVNRDIITDEVSWGSHFKYSYDVLNQTRPGILQSGLYLKYTKLHVESLERTFPLFSFDNETLRVQREIQKVTPMGFVQVNFLPKKKLFLGCQLAAGIMYGEVLKERVLTREAVGYQIELFEGINGIYEHGVFDNNDFAKLLPVFQVNLLVGYEF